MGCSATKQLRSQLEGEGQEVELITFGCLSGGCQYLGLSSKGVGQMKGNGVLALTNKKLVLKGFSGVKDFECQRKHISKVEVTNVYPSGLSAVPLIKVTFSGENIPEDSLHVCVTPVYRGKWVDALQTDRNKA